MTIEKINELLLTKGYTLEKRNPYITDLYDCYDCYYPCLDKLKTVYIDTYRKSLWYTIPLMEDTNIYTALDRYITISLDELTVETLETILEKIEKQMTFLTEYKKKKLMYKRKQELSKDF